MQTGPGANWPQQTSASRNSHSDHFQQTVGIVVASLDGARGLLLAGPSRRTDLRVSFEWTGCHTGGQTHIGYIRLRNTGTFVPSAINSVLISFNRSFDVTTRCCEVSVGFAGEITRFASPLFSLQARFMHKTAID